MHADATCCGGTKAGNSSLYHIQTSVSYLTLSPSCPSLHLHPGLPPDSSLPQDCALLIFSPLLYQCPSLFPGPLLHPQTTTPPNASPWSPAQSYWTYSFWVSTVLTYRFFRAETFLEIPGLAPCLVENKGLGKGWKRS